MTVLVATRKEGKAEREERIKTLATENDLTSIHRRIVRQYARSQYEPCMLQYVKPKRYGIWITTYIQSLALFTSKAIAKND